MTTRVDVVAQVIDRLRPALQADGADLRILNTEGTVLTIELILTDKSCLECILPASNIEAVILRALAGTELGFTNVRLVDPRAQSAMKTP